MNAKENMSRLIAALVHQIHRGLEICVVLPSLVLSRAFSEKGGSLFRLVKIFTSSVFEPSFRRFSYAKATLVVYLRLLLVAVLVSTLATGTWSAPGRINYQGKLANSSGNPLSGSYDFEFRIYDAESGGNLLWSETYAGANQVTVDNGVFNVQLGSMSAVSPSVFSGDNAYLEVWVNSEMMSPRERLVTAPYAFRASGLDDDSVGTRHIIASTISLSDINLTNVDTHYVTTGTAQTINAVKTFTANISMNNSAMITDLPAPTNDGDAARKSYVDSQVGGSGGWTRDSGNGEVELNTITDEVGIGTGVARGKLHVTATNDQLLLEDSDGVADSRLWVMKSDSGNFEVTAANDGWSSWTAALQINRTGTTINRVLFPNGSLGIGAASPASKLHLSSGTFTLDGTNPSIVFTGGSTVAGGIDFGGGADDDLTAADVTALTGGGTTALHSHSGLTPGNDSVGTTQIINSTVALVDLNTTDIDTRYLTTGTVQTVSGAKTFSSAVTVNSGIDFGGGADDDLTAADVTALTGGGTTALHSHSGLTPGNDSVGTTQIINSTVALVDLNTTDIDTRYLTTGTAQNISALKTFSPASGAPFAVGNTTLVTSLNADLLDGISEGSFLRSDTSDSYTSGTLTFSAGTTLSLAGNAALGTDTDDVDISTHVAVTGNVNVTGTLSANDISVGDGSGTDSLVFNATSGFLRLPTAVLNTAGQIRYNSGVLEYHNGSSAIAISSAPHTHTGITPDLHAASHYPSGGDSIDAVYLTTHTNQGVTGTKTFYADIVMDTNRLVDGVDVGAHDTANSGVHGVGTGLIVGTDLTQTLSNKTLTNTGSITQNSGSIAASLSTTTVNGRLDVTGAVRLNGGTLTTANTIDFGAGASDDLTATDVATLTDGSDANSLHTHTGLTPGAHATSHGPNGSDPISSMYLTTGTAQSISALKTFSPAAGAPFAVGNNTVVTNLNADLLDGVSSASFLRSDASDSFTSGTLNFSAGTTLRMDGTAAIGTDTDDVDVSTHLAVAGDVTVAGGDLLVGSVTALRDNGSFVTLQNTGGSGASMLIGTYFQMSGDVVVDNQLTTFNPALDISTNVDVAGAIRLNGGTLATANTIDFGAGANDDLTATDVTDLTDGGATALHTHTAGDADTLDGLDSTQFLRSDASDSFTSGTLNFSAGTTLRMDGTAAIGTDTDDVDVSTHLFVSGNLAVGGGSAANDDYLYFDDGATEFIQWDEAGGRFLISDDYEIQDTTPQVAFEDTTTGHDDYNIVVDADLLRIEHEDSATTFLVIDNTGKVGIGSGLAPSGKLHLSSGTFFLDGTNPSIVFSGGSTVSGGIDFGAGAADDLTAADVTDLTDGGDTALHTHTGLTPGAHAASHGPSGSDPIDTMYLTTGTAQTVSAQKTFNATLAMSGANVITLGGDVSLSRGAANQLDLATGDSLNLVSGAILQGGTTRLDSSGNLSNIGTISATGGVTISGAGAGMTYSGTGNHAISASAGTLQIGAHTLTGAVTGNGQNITGLGNLSQNVGTITASFSSTTVNGTLDVIGPIQLTGGTLTTANTIDFGSGANDDLTATDVTDLTDGAGTTLHTHAASGITAGTFGAGNYTFPGIAYFANGTTYQVDAAGAATFGLTQGSNLKLTNGSNQDVYIQFPGLTQASSSNRIFFSTGTTFSNTMAFASMNPSNGQFVSRGGFTTGTPDIAEYIMADADVEDADVVSVAEDNAGENAPGGETVKVRKSQGRYESRIIGVITEVKEGFRINSHMKTLDDQHPGKPLVLAGRVPVKVTLENGPIKRGDYLTSSSKPGHAMKATEPGPTVGIALDDFDGSRGESGKVLCFVDIGERNLSEVVRKLEAQAARLEAENQDLRARLSGLRDMEALQVELIRLQRRMDAVERQHRGGGQLTGGPREPGVR